MTMMNLSLKSHSSRMTSSTRFSILSIIVLSYHFLLFFSTARPTCAAVLSSPITMKLRQSSVAASTAATMASTVALLPRGGGVMNKLLTTSVKSTQTTSTTTSSTMNSLPSILQSFVQTIVNARSHLAAAAAARAVSIFGMYPVDTIKTRLQMKQSDAFRMSGLYKGVTGSLIGQVPYGVLTFGSYEIYKQSLLNRFPNVKPAFIYALAAVMGDVTGSGWLCPSEVVKQQLQAGIYPSMSEAIQGIWKKSGLAGFYQGYTGGLARDVPFRVAQLTTFEMTKSLYLQAKRRRSSNINSVSLSALEAAACGAAAGSISAAITNPLDRIKTLMMTDTANVYGGSVLTCASKIVQEDGLSGLLKGVIPRVTYIAPSVCIFFVTYELVQQKMKKPLS